MDEPAPPARSSTSAAIAASRSRSSPSSSAPARSRARRSSRAVLRHLRRGLRGHDASAPEHREDQQRDRLERRDLPRGDGRHRDRAAARAARRGVRPGDLVTRSRRSAGRARGRPRPDAARGRMRGFSAAPVTDRWHTRRTPRRVESRSAAACWQARGRCSHSAGPRTDLVIVAGAVLACLLGRDDAHAFAPKVKLLGQIAIGVGGALAGLAPAARLPRCARGRVRAGGRHEQRQPARQHRRALLRHHRRGARRRDRRRRDRVRRGAARGLCPARRVRRLPALQLPAWARCQALHGRLRLAPARVRPRGQRARHRGAGSFTLGRSLVFPCACSRSPCSTRAS